MHAKIKRTLREQLASYLRLTSEQSLLRDTFERLIRFALDSQKRRQEQETYLATLARIRMQSIVVQWL